MIIAQISDLLVAVILLVALAVVVWFGFLSKRR